MPQQPEVVAAWAETGQVRLFNIKKHLKALDTPGAFVASTPPIYECTAHKTEGFALDWSPCTEGKLLSGDCENMIYETKTMGSHWVTDKTPYTGHTGSVEDIQWSPSEATVFASCSADQSIKVWDTRAAKKSPMLSVHAHDADVNVMSWNYKVAYLMASGADDGAFRIWDLRNFSSDKTVAHFRFHNRPITSIEWNPHDETQLVVSSADHQVTIWDMSLEADEDEGLDHMDFPQQLFFIHQGQNDVKEVHWHPQVTNALITTAYDGFNVFKTSNAAS